MQSGRVPNVLVAVALGAALAAEPTLVAVLGAFVAPLPLLALAVPRLAGMGDVKFAMPIGAVLAGELGLAAVPWWWVWSLLGAALTLTAVGLVARGRSEVPLAPALFVAALVGLLSG